MMGSCYYDGDLCSVAIPAVEGDEVVMLPREQINGSYTATMDGFLMATTCYADQSEDTDVEVYTGVVRKVRHY